MPKPTYRIVLVVRDEPQAVMSGLTKTAARRHLRGYVKDWRADPHRSATPLGSNWVTDDGVAFPLFRLRQWARPGCRGDSVNRGVLCVEVEP